MTSRGAIMLTRAIVGGLCAAASVTLLITAPTPAAGAAGATESALTKSGEAPFAGLDVTVSQTKDLINQVVEVSWTGGRPTEPANGNFALHYLQIMQCWGDPDTGPDREQCQFGGRLGDGRGGPQSATRQVNYGPTLVDPLETEYVKDPLVPGNVFVPFQAVDGQRSTGSRSSYYDASTTNELPYARTRADGTGNELFEIQTALEAPGLGCGQAVPAAGGGTTGRPCWLVVVPRGNEEVDGSIRLPSAAFQLESSPLSTTNWRRRIEFPLGFQEVSRSCDLAKERRVIGQALAAEAVSRWQPALCAGGSATFNYSQVSDRFARRQLVTGNPSLALTSSPVAPSDVPATRPLVYAPVALSGIAIAYIVERQPSSLAPTAERNREGSRITDLRLTPRIVAKLLTQSYANAAPGDDPAVAGNPESLVDDPEFRELNPDFAHLLYPALSDVLVPTGQSDAARTLWEWVQADRAARDFLDGSPDASGMRVNPAYEGIALPVDDLPKNDAYCRTFTDGRLPLCTLERRPYAASLQEAGRSVARGETLARQTWDPLASPPAWKRTDPQFNGTRAILALTDLATAARYGLQTAQLRNHAGAFVAPTEASLLAGLGAMQPRSVADVLEPAVTNPDVDSYPLTTLTYAATAPSALSASTGAEYADFITYAALDGQTPGVRPGDLPEGYVPLPRTLRVQALAAATTIRRTAGVTVTPSPSTTPSASRPVSRPAVTSTKPTLAAAPQTPPATPPPSPSPSRSPSASPTPSRDTGSGSGFSTSGNGIGLSGVVDEAGPVAPPTPGRATTPSPTADVALAPVADVALTPAEPLGRVRYVLAGLLLMGGLSALGGPALLRIATKERP